MIPRHATTSLLFVTLLLASCSLVSNSEQQKATHSLQGCDAGAVQNLIGQTASPSLLEQIRQRAGAQTVQIIGPYDDVSLKYNSKRLNLDVDENLLIRQIHCG